ncbi:hypothetical protein [Vreelandella titanicae]|uniref:hypothetical protein n=1 Tax=Vreelandella titanicae TaxID=664683 RepID=UPI001F21E1AB|nr:hypothetical protein [Halomonas titanicae]MCE7519033.1 hypothetical protein [Halomonas titanicae]
MSNSTQMFMNVVREKHEQYKAALNSLLSALSDNDQAKKLETNNHLLKVAKELSSILAQEDRPSWLKETILATDEYARKNKNPKSIASGSGWALLQKLMNLRQHGMAHSWNFESAANAKGYDFDAVFVESRKNSNLAQLFDSMIASLEKMLATGEIDSIRAIEALQKLIATLKQNKNGSYFSTMASWEFVRSFTRNVAWESLGAIPGVQPVKVAFEKTLEETNIEMKKLQDDVASKLRERFDVVPKASLTYKREDPLLLEDKSEKDEE